MKILKNSQSFLLVICLFLSFVLFYISYYFFINGVFCPAVRMVFLGSKISDYDEVYENSVIESIGTLFLKKSYFNMCILLIFSIIIPILKFIMVSDNFYSFMKLYILKINHKEESDINLINIINENCILILRKFDILSSISRFQFVDVLISMFIVSSLNLYLINTEMLDGAYYFINYCILSTIASFFLLTFSSIKIHLYKKENIKIYPLLSENPVNLSKSNSILSDTKMELYKGGNKITSYNNRNICIKYEKGKSNLENKDDKVITDEKIIEEEQSLKNVIVAHNKNSSNSDIEEINNSLNEINNIDKNINENEKDQNQLFCYNKLQNLNNINHISKIIKNNNAYIYLKKKKFNTLLKSNLSINAFNILKLIYAIFLFFYSFFCIYLIIMEKCNIFGIYIYLSYFNFNIDGILIDYKDMLNTLKIKVDKNYIYPFFVLLPFFIPLLIGISFFLSVLFLNIYYITFSNSYKKSPAINNELVLNPEVGENQVTVSERYNYLYIKKEIEKNDRLSNTSDDLSSPNYSTLTSSKSEDINTNFIYSKFMNFCFSMSVFFSYLSSFFLHFSLGEVITISIVTFYQIVKHTNNLNITFLYKSEKVKFCKYMIFIIYGMVCLSFYMYVRRWELYLNKLRKTKKKILLFEKNRYSEIVDWNIQKNENCDIPIYSLFFRILFKRKIYNVNRKIQKEHRTHITCVHDDEYNEIDEEAYQNTAVGNEEFNDVNLSNNKKNMCIKNKEDEYFITHLPDNNEIPNSLEKKNYEEKNISNFMNENLIHFKSVMPIKSILISNLEKRRKQKKRDSSSKVLILIHMLLFIFILLISIMAFIKKEKALQFKVYSINKTLNNFFKSSKFHSLIPASIGKCKTKKYVAKTLCYDVGVIYHEEETFYHATLYFLEDINSIEVQNLQFYYEDNAYYLVIDGFFKHIYGPLFLKLCLGSDFCPFSTYSSILGNMATFSITLTGKCNDKNAPHYISNLFIKDLKITKIELVKDSGLLKNIDIKLDDVQEHVQDKVNSMLAKKKKIIKWRDHKYHLEAFLNYLITKNTLSSFSCEPIYD